MRPVVRDAGLIAAAISLAVAGPALGDPRTQAPISTPVLVEGSGGTDAPDGVPLDQTEPTSVVNRVTLDHFVAPTGNYDEAVALTPSVLDIDPNGPGLGETETLTIRGFTDGQYNVTFDGIPFADSDDFTHHSAAYFIARDLGSVTVDRGPGDATTIGDATFGGTIALRSIDPAPDRAVSPDIALGTYGTVLGGARVDTGAGADGARLVIDGEGERSGGALDNVEQRRLTLFARLDVPLGPRTDLTIVANLARTAENDPPGATRAEIAADGPGVALSSDPSSQAFEGFNDSSYRTDFSYAALSTTGENGWTLTDTLYSYGLDRCSIFGLDPNGETPNGTAIGAADVPAQSAKNGLRAFGDILRDSLPLGAGVTLRTGFWIERQVNSRRLDEVDATLGVAPNPILPTVAGVPGSAAIEREQAETLVTFQPYAQIDWEATTRLLLSVGVKGAVFARSIEAPVMEGTRLPTEADRTFAAPLPSAIARYRVTRGWSAYGQVARGFLAPPLQSFDVSDPASAPIAPEETWNFQAGTVWRDGATRAALDVYEILFTDEIGSRTVGGETIDFDEGSATYRGVEAEASEAPRGRFRTRRQRVGQRRPPGRWG